MPAAPVHFAAFTLIGGRFYGRILSVTPTDGSYTITMQETDPDAFKKLLNEL